ncbi:Mu transposase C-terminal domain-containing protein [Streptosporangium roseum]|uniref:Mu transposase C-terminal domain-containing protein n=1 Tax=Streptosporangium roseum TaxID=2001 RepID=UPI000AE0634F
MAAAQGEGGVTYRTLQRWLADYRRGGLEALAPVTRSDKGLRRFPDELVALIEGLTLKPPRPSVTVTEQVTIRYDPRDITEIRIYLRTDNGNGPEETFLCRVICPELAGTTISLKEITTAQRPPQATPRPAHQPHRRRRPAPGRPPRTPARRLPPHQPGQPGDHHPAQR